MSEEIKQALEEMEARIIAVVKQEMNPKSRKEKEQKQVFHNTKRLLKNYSNFVEHYNQTEFVASTLIDEDILELINYRMDDDKVDDTYIKSLFKTKERTAKILNHINKMFEYFERAADEAHDVRKQRISRVLKMVYIDGMKHEDVAHKLNMDKATVYRDINAGISEMSPLLFGIDGVKLD